MKILLSAFACEPHQGSEPEIGWKWAMSLARLGHEVWVLTRLVHRPAIEAELVRLADKRPRFVYYDLPGPLCAGNSKLALYLYYPVWQWCVIPLALQLHAGQRFDYVHHATYGGLRGPSFMGTLGIPFIFGPLGGGERAPWRLRLGYGVKGYFLDALRDVANAAVRIDPLMRRTFDSATKIYVTSRDTLRLLPRWCREKAAIESNIGSADEAADFEVQAAERSRNDPTFRVLYVGQFLYWKGMHLGMAAFARLVKVRPDVRLTMVGQGAAKARWQKIAQRLGIAEKIDWEPWLHRRELTKFYGSHDVMLFPSLHDSGGLAVLESLAHGTPVVCLAIGGPGHIVTNDCGRSIEVAGRSAAEVVDQLGQALIDLTDEGTRSRLATGARRRCRQFYWEEKAARIYTEML